MSWVRYWDELKFWNRKFSYFQFSGIFETQKQKTGHRHKNTKNSLEQLTQNFHHYGKQKFSFQFSVFSTYSVYVSTVGLKFEMSLEYPSLLRSRLSEQYLPSLRCIWSPLEWRQPNITLVYTVHFLQKIRSHTRNALKLIPLDKSNCKQDKWQQNGWQGRRIYQPTILKYRCEFFLNWIRSDQIRSNQIKSNQI